MIKSYRSRAVFAVVLIAATFSCFAVTPAAIEMSTGIRYVVPDASADQCSTKAKAALSAYLQNPTESNSGSGDWLAFGPIGVQGPSTAAAAVRCYPADKGYVVTFNCVVESADNPYTADALCLDVYHSFSGKAVTPLATPPPLATGCTTKNLVGTWTSDRSGPTFTMDVNGNLTDSEGTSGSWILYGNTVTLTYYGNHALTLKPDGKHMSGGGYDLTRKC
ncbi:MAG: hypothetical protein M3R51_04330 [Candidatus Eremiobacteraeota bacterium]|nr:hypothetical protein [Candidatus Eremiobacteraeota bacterium]